MARPDTRPGIAPEQAPWHPFPSKAPSQALSPDGRIARRQRNRERVVDAYVELLQEGVAVPTAGELAERAEVTARTVYRYLHEDAQLRGDIAERVVSTLVSSPIPDDVEPASQNDRIDSFIAFRLDAFERTPIIMSVAHRQQAHDPIVTTAIGATRSIIETELDRCFAPELNRLDGAERMSTVVALQVAVLFESLQHAYEEMKHSRRDVHALLCWNFETLLSDSNRRMHRSPDTSTV